MMPIVYRKIKSDESQNFRRLRLECLKNFPDNFGTSYEDEVIKPKLAAEETIERDDNPDKMFFGAFAGDELIGIAGFVRENRRKTRHRGEIVSIYVSTGFQGQKVGENLLRLLIGEVFKLDGMESVELTVVADNDSASRLYERLGFETYGIRPNYFKSGEKYWNQRFMLLMKENFQLKDKI